MNYIKRSKDVKIVGGKLSYHESMHAWAVLRFKKEFLDEFRDLKDKAMQFGYKLMMFYDYDQINSCLQKAREEGVEPPVLLWIERL